MSTLTKEQLEKLTPQQRELLAGVEAQRLRKREELLRQTGLYRGFYAIPTFFVLAAFVIMVRDTTKTMLLPFCIIALGGLIHFHAAGVNRRIDALVELLDADLKKCTHRDDDHAA
jgi:hypothetical protein